MKTTQKVKIDFEIGCETKEEAESISSCLEECLKDYATFKKTIGKKLSNDVIECKMKDIKILISDGNWEDTDAMREEVDVALKKMGKILDAVLSRRYLSERDLIIGCVDIEKPEPSDVGGYVFKLYYENEEIPIEIDSDGGIEGMIGYKDIQIELKHVLSNLGYSPYSYDITMVDCEIDDEKVIYERADAEEEDMWLQYHERD